MPSLVTPVKRFRDAVGGAVGRGIHRFASAEPPSAPYLPEPAAATWLTGRTQELWCEPGEHEWTRLGRARSQTHCVPRPPLPDEGSVAHRIERCKQLHCGLHLPKRDPRPHRHPTA